MSADLLDTPDAELITRCAAQDQAAFRAIYDRWGARLHGIALRITRDPSLAADATHDAFVQLWNEAGRFDETLGSAGGWLVSLARYRALDIVRRRGREDLGFEPTHDAAESGPDPLDQLLSSADGAALHRCLLLLDAARRRLVLMAFVDGLSHSQLAARLGQPIGTVKSTIRRSLISLGECLSA